MFALPRLLLRVAVLDDICGDGSMVSAGSTVVTVRFLVAFVVLTVFFVWLFSDTNTSTAELDEAVSSS